MKQKQPKSPITHKYRLYLMKTEEKDAEVYESDDWMEIGNKILENPGRDCCIITHPKNVILRHRGGASSQWAFNNRED